MRSQCSLYTAELKTLCFVFICSAEGLFTLTSNPGPVINLEWSVKQIHVIGAFTGTSLNNSHVFKVVDSCQGFCKVPL